MSLSSRFVAAWYAPHLTALTAPLVPLAVAFGAIAFMRRALYRARLLRAHQLPVPVIVVGNITVGGSGKTPLVAALTRSLAERGWHPGIVSRGHGRASSRSTPVIVAPDADAAEVGDEPLLLAHTGIPVAVATDRVAAARALLAAHPECNVIVADDGLQHYRLARDFEVAVVDAATTRCGRIATRHRWHRRDGSRRQRKAGRIHDPLCDIGHDRADRIHHPQRSAIGIGRQWRRTNCRRAGEFVCR